MQNRYKDKENGNANVHDFYNTGNIKFIAHGLNEMQQVVKFDAFALPESDALLSVSYMERPESKYRLFRPQGLFLDVDTKYIHGGGETDSGSGCSKNINGFIERYTFGGERETDRVFISKLIKTALNLNDKEYIKFLKENENKSFVEIEPKEVREKLICAFAKMKSKTRGYSRNYNEMYVLNPKVNAVFAYNKKGKLGETKEFLNSEDNLKDINFLKEYANKKDIPFVLFGN